MVKALIAATLGLLLATVGRDTFSGAGRFTFSSLELADGIDFVIVAMGLFGVGEILYNLEARHGKVHVPAAVANIWPSRKDLRQSSGAIGRGSVIGFFLGVLPGGGAVLASLAAYAAEKRRAKNPERFGRGAIEGVAAPESANNAAATSSFIPLLTLGIPANATMGMLFGALLILGITPGPAARRGATRRVLGRHQLDVHRQHHAADPQHPAGRAVRADPAHAPGDPGADHRPHHHPRRLHDQQLRLRHLRHDRLRPRRLPHEEDRLRARPAGARVRARLDPRGQRPPVDAHLRRRPDRVRHPADLRDDPRGFLVVVLLCPPSRRCAAARTSLATDATTHQRGREDAR